MRCWMQKRIVQRTRAAMSERKDERIPSRQLSQKAPDEGGRSGLKSPATPHLAL